MPMMSFFFLVMIWIQLTPRWGYPGYIKERTRRMRRNAMRCNATQKGEARPGVDCFRESYIGGFPWLDVRGGNKWVTWRKKKKEEKSDETIRIGMEVRKKDYGNGIFVRSSVNWNVVICAIADTPLVSGTRGWLFSRIITWWVCPKSILR